MNMISSNVSIVYVNSSDDLQFGNGRFAGGESHRVEDPKFRSSESRKRKKHRIPKRWQVWIMSYHDDGLQCVRRNVESDVAIDLWRMWNPNELDAVLMIWPEGQPMPGYLAAIVDHDSCVKCVMDE